MNLETKRMLYFQQIAIYEPNIELESWQENREGLVNDVVIVNNSHVYRFPQNDEWAVDDLWAEANILGFLRGELDIRIPRWTIYDGELIGHPFIGYEMIAGRPLQKFIITQLTEKEQDALAEQIATFLQQMHTASLAEAKLAKIRPSITNRTAQDWLKLYKDVQTELFPHLMSFQKEWVHQHFAPIVQDEQWMAYDPTVMNGDLAPYHLLYSEETKLLNGIIDFGTAGIGDPACDIACLLDQYGEPFVKRIATFYPKINDLLPRATFWAGTLWLQWALGGLRNPDDPSWFFVHIGRR